ncbi:hypothetical protein RHMOL_Rhmol04G0067200 [Rhododendron molle]|uniref:Uncharacterized protein n=1 Tax=Rhododendron molle TaxID=49168 RepID=A0ACC0NXP7_RHOML|nr:hypothetical protein RHMOL_Rhmol04G0067200 [Rhododendron molle]
MRSSKKKKKKASHNTAAADDVTFSDLPNHITCDILSRLPLNSIFAFKRVCKLWRDLTLEPYFAKLHLSRSPLSLFFYHDGNDNNNNNNSPSSHFEIIPLHDHLALGRRNRAMKFRTEIHFPHMHAQVVASCNGSILLRNSSSSDDDLVTVCNPLRAQHFILPEPPKLALQTHKSILFGFGHSSSTDQYKVLRLTHMGSPARLYCDVYAIGIDDEWRSIGYTGQPPTRIISQLVFLNGALHWIGIEKSRFIYSFDIEKEQFGSFPLPSCIEEDCNCLGVVDNWLYLHNETQSIAWRIWAMKDYGDFGSWTLEWFIKEPIIYMFTGSVEPLKVLKDGSLLMKFTKTNLRTQVIKTTLASYNPQTRVLKKIKYHVTLPRTRRASVADIPCFVSPMDALK